jgi:hypothetical protein
MYSIEERDKILNSIFQEIAKGKSVRGIFDGGQVEISRETFYVWLDEDKSKSDQYAKVCEVRADKIFEDILDIADDGTNDYVDKDGITVLNSEHIQRSRLRVDARKWMLGKMNPKKYGDKVSTDITSKGEKIQTNVIVLGNGVNPDEATT